MGCTRRYNAPSGCPGGHTSKQAVLGLKRNEFGSLVALRLPLSSVLLVVLPLIALLAASSHALTVTSVAVSPTTVNSYAEYAIDATIASNSGQRGIDANEDSILVTFPAGATLPGSIPANLLTVNGTSCNALVIRDQTVAVPSPVNVSRNATIVLVFSASANIQNPSSAGSNYSLSVTVTTAAPAGTDGPGSSTFQITTASSTVMAAAVQAHRPTELVAAEYYVEFCVGSSGALTANQGTISVEFPTGTTVPSGNIPGVDVDGVSAIASGSGNTITVTTPVSVGNGASLSLHFAKTSGLVNPDAGTHTAQVWTSSETTHITSDSYDLMAATVLRASAFPPEPSTVNAAAEYELHLYTSSSGALVAGEDVLTLIFPHNTYIPATIPPATIVLEGGGFIDNPSAVTTRQAIATDADTVEMVTSLDIGNTDEIEVKFSTSSGLLNPSISGNYTISVATSRDGEVLSNPIHVSSATSTVSQPTVSVSPATPSTLAAYTICSNVGVYGRFHPDESTISITFPAGTTIGPAVSGTPSNTTVNGVSAALVNVSGQTVAVTLPAAVQVGNSEQIEIVLANAANMITNPTAGSYTLDLRTSVETTDVQSANYGISATSPLTISGVTPGTATVNSTSDYTINVSGAAKIDNFANDYVVVTFPVGTVLPASISTANAQINGSNSSSVSVNQSARSVTMYVAGNNVTPSSFSFLSGAGIVNPPVPSQSAYVIQAYTSQNTPVATSSAYTIAEKTTTSVGSVSVTPTPSVVNATGVSYEVVFTTSSTGGLAGGTFAGSSRIYLDFDTATIVPSSIDAGNITVGNTPCSEATVPTSGAGGVVRLVVPGGVTVANSTQTTVLLNGAAGLNHGASTGTFTAVVTTSADSAAGGTANYSLAATQNLAVDLVTPYKAIVNAGASYTIKFTTGSSGALSVDDTIHVAFPSGTVLPDVMSGGDVRINGATVTGSIATDAANRLIGIPTPATVGNVTDVTLLINETAGLKNPTGAGSYTLSVNTTQEPTDRTSPSYTLTAATSSISAAAVTVSPAGSGTADADYTATFNTGTYGRLAAGSSTITLALPTGTTVGTVSGVTVNGAAASAAGDGGARTVAVTVPASVSIDNASNVSVVVPTGITNPTAGAYTLTVSTSVESGAITSSEYAIAAAATAVGVGTVAVVPDTTARAAEYSIPITPGVTLPADGVLTLAFPDGTTMPNGTIASTNATIGGVDATAISGNVSTRRLTITNPSSWPASTQRTVLVKVGAGVTNPSSSGTYTMQAWTDVEPTPATSSGYTIDESLSAPTSLGVVADPAETSSSATWTWTFTTSSSGALSAEEGTIRLLYPNSTTMPGTITSTKVSVNSYDAHAVSAASGGGADPDTVTITVPTAVSAGAEVTVVVDATASVITATSQEAATYMLCTSSDPVLVSGDYSLPVVLVAFSAQAVAHGVHLTWQTGGEVNSCGFHVQHRGPTSSGYVRVTDQLIPSLGNSPMGQAYEYYHTSVLEPGPHCYRLEEVSLNGGSEFYGPVSIDYTSHGIREYSLSNVAPNPMNPAASVRFSVAEPSRVRIGVWNILGQRIRILSDERMQPGWYRLTWDGIDDSGRSVGSGVYALTMRAEGESGEVRPFVAVRQFTVIR